MPKRWKNRTQSKIQKKPIIITLLSICFMMLGLPMLIVLPFENDPPVSYTDESASVPANQKVEDKSLESAFSVEVFRSKENTTEDVPVEEYVTRVVASEMPSEFEMEALKAQALAARTYIVRFLISDTDAKLPNGADVTDTVEHQVYKSDEELRTAWGQEYHNKMEKIKTAVAQTQGQIITYNDAPITPAFFSTSNGYTENAEKYWENELPYLKSVESPWDESESPKFYDQKIFTKQQVNEKLGTALGSASPDIKLKRTKSQRVEEMVIESESFSGREVREKLGLQSSDFTVTERNDHFVFTTKGYGHGVGMSQYGANGMAKEGKSYNEIIRYYYKGAEVATVDQAAPKLVEKGS